MRGRLKKPYDWGVEVSWAFVADFANVDTAGKLNIIGVFRDFNAQQFPLEVSFYFVAMMEASPAEAGSMKTVRVVLMDEDARDTLFSQDVQFPVQQHELGRGQPITVQLVMQMHGVAFRRSGTYQIAVLVNGETKKSLPLRVGLAPVG